MADDPKPEAAPTPQAGPPPEGGKPVSATPPSDAAPAPAAAPAAAKPAPPKPPAAPKPPAVMVTSPWEGKLPDVLKSEFGEAIRECVSYLDQKFTVVQPSAAVDVLAYLKEEQEFDYLVDLTAVHWPKRDEAFDLIYILYSFARNERIRIKAMIREGEKPRTAVPVHPTANWLEREVFDMFGIEFEGHPNMTRILLPDEWNGYPLRKDYGILQMDNRWVQENLGIESGQ
jgi:NADH-quinone oxidoreductase subunit C